jgi:hypothetical protein
MPDEQPSDAAREIAQRGIESAMEGTRAHWRAIGPDPLPTLREAHEYAQRLLETAPAGVAVTLEGNVLSFEPE